MSLCSQLKELVNGRVRRVLEKSLREIKLLKSVFSSALLIPSDLTLPLWHLLFSLGRHSCPDFGPALDWDLLSELVKHLVMISIHHHL